MSNLRTAAQQALEALERCAFRLSDPPTVASAVNTLKAALEQPEQEPVAWMTPGKDIITCNGAGTRFNDWTPLYTHPPRRDWRGLDRDETMHLMNDTAENYWADEAHIQQLARAIEAALKERNA
jgi:hypothetical protein